MGASLPYEWLSYLGTGEENPRKKAVLLHSLACFASLCQSGCELLLVLPHALPCLKHTGSLSAVQSGNPMYSGEQPVLYLAGWSIRPLDGRTAALLCL